MADVFISYARDDRAKIEKLAAALEAEGFSLWWDRHIEGGAEYSKDIEQALNASKVVIVAWSAQSIESTWVKDEAITARDQGKLIPVTIDGTSSPMGFKQFHLIDLDRWNGKTDWPGFSDLARTIKARLTGETPPPTEAPKEGFIVRGAAVMKKKPPTSVAITFIIAAAIVLIVVFDRDDEADAPAERLSDVLEMVQELEKVGDSARPQTEPASTADLSAVSTTAIDDNVVAVLPFANRSPSQEDAYFADGVHDDLLTKLSKISALRVISRTSVMRFRDTEQPIPEIANTLGAAVVMEGAVQRAGNRVRINVQLIDGETDEHLWAEIYDRELTAENIFDIQEEITRAIAGALEAVLSGTDEAELTNRPTENVAAYNAYLRALALMPMVFTVTQDQLERAISAFDEAIALDPDFAAAHARKSYAQLMIYWLIGDGDQWRTVSRETLTRAQAIVPDDVETLLAQGYYYYWGELDYEAADASFDKLLARAPNHAAAMSAKAFTQRRRGEFAAALEGLLRVSEIDPLDISVLLEISDTARSTGQWDVAEVAIERAKELAPRHRGVAAYASFLAIDMGDAARAWRAINRPVEGGDHRFFYWRLEAARMTRSRQNIELTLATWPEALRAPASFPEFYDIARAEALYELGDREEAMALLARAKQTIEARDVPYPGGWGGNIVIYPVLLPGLMEDLATVAELADAYEANRAVDAQGDPNRHLALAAAFARAGDEDRAVIYLERIFESESVWSFPAFALEPAFDALHDHPQWQAMKARYMAWAEANEAGQ